MKKHSGLIVAALACALAMAGCESASKLLPDRPRQSPGVAMQDVTFHSAALERDMPYRVYLPAQITPGRQLPVAYLLHGNGGSYRDWSNYSDVSAYAAKGLILVMVEGGSSYYVNSAGTPKDRYEDYLAHDLIADVEARFPVATGRGNRAIAGVSMGGFAAARLALAKPDLFVFAGAISPAIDAPSRHFSLRRWSQSMRFRSIFGPDGSEARRASDPYLLVQHSDPKFTPYIYMTAGEQEPLREPIERFAKALARYGFAHEFHLKPGHHDWNEWNAQIPECFESLLAHLKVSQGS